MRIPPVFYDIELYRVDEFSWILCTLQLDSKCHLEFAPYSSLLKPNIYQLNSYISTSYPSKSLERIRRLFDGSR